MTRRYRVARPEEHRALMVQDAQAFGDSTTSISIDRSVARTRVEELRDEPGHEGELAQVIGALERVRLDLLRLKAGQGSAEEVGAALHAAAELSEATGSRRVPETVPQRETS